jgi:hypothetical protein
MLESGIVDNNATTNGPLAATTKQEEAQEELADATSDLVFQNALQAAKEWQDRMDASKREKRE